MTEHELTVSASTEDPGDPRMRVLRATLRDHSGEGIAGATVRFTLDGPGRFDGHGSSSWATDVTDTDGFAWTRWVAPPVEEGGGVIEARVVAHADIDDAEIALDHFHHAIEIGPYAPAAP